MESFWFALTGFLQALTLLIVWYLRTKLEKVSMNVDGKLTQLMKAREVIAFKAGQDDEKKTNGSKNGPPLP